MFVSREHSNSESSSSSTAADSTSDRQHLSGQPTNPMNETTWKEIFQALLFLNTHIPTILPLLIHYCECNK
jgi:hypothetical protein